MIYVFKGVKEDDLEEYFGHFGDVICVNIMHDKASGRHRGFAFVDFNDYDPVDKVICKLYMFLIIFSSYFWFEL